MDNDDDDDDNDDDDETGEEYGQREDFNNNNNNDDDDDDTSTNNLIDLAGLQENEYTNNTSNSIGFLGHFMTAAIYKNRYQRNNKRGGLKNLRCFPSCQLTHKDKGFCGRQVNVRVEFPKITTNHSSLYCWGEFIRIDDAAAATVKAGQKYTLTEALAKERSKEDPLGVWIKGDRLSQEETNDPKFKLKYIHSNFSTSTSSSAIFELNKEKRGWHYGWVSNKHTCNAEHCLQIYVFELVNKHTNEMTCRAVFRSPKFIIFCRRRRRFVISATAPIHVSSTPASTSVIKSSAKRSRNEKSENNNEKKIISTTTKKSKKETVNNNNNVLDSIPILNMPEISASSSTSFDDIFDTKPSHDNEVGFVSSYLGYFSSNSSSKNYQTISLDHPRMEALMRRIMTSLSKYRDTQQNILKEHVTSSVSTNFSSKSYSNKNKEEEDIQPLSDGDNNSDFSLFDTLEYFADEMVVESETTSDFDFGFNNNVNNSLAPPILSTSSSISSVTAGNEISIDSLAQYLQENKNFKTSVQNLHQESPNGIPDYQSFLRAAQVEVENYLNQRHITLEQFDAIYLSGQTQIPSSSSSSSSTTFPGPANHVPNISGKWQRTEASERIMQNQRSSSGTPWVLSKMFEFMESKFEIIQHGIEVTCRLERAFFHPGISFILDGEERPWGVQIPFLAGLSKGWVYRACVESNRIVVTHTIGGQRLVRTLWRDRDRLFFTVILQNFDYNLGFFIQVSETMQEAVLLNPTI